MYMHYPDCFSSLKETKKGKTRQRQQVVYKGRRKGFKNTLSPSSVPAPSFLSSSLGGDSDKLAMCMALSLPQGKPVSQASR